MAAHPNGHGQRQPGHPMRLARPRRARIDKHGATDLRAPHRAVAAMNPPHAGQ